MNNSITHCYIKKQKSALHSCRVALDVDNLFILIRGKILNKHKSKNPKIKRRTLVTPQMILPWRRQTNRSVTGKSLCCRNYLDTLVMSSDITRYQLLHTLQCDLYRRRNQKTKSKLSSKSTGLGNVTTIYGLETCVKQLAH